GRWSEGGRTQGHAGHVMATLNNLVLGLLRLAGFTNLAVARRYCGADLVPRWRYYRRRPEHGKSPTTRLKHPLYATLPCATMRYDEGHPVGRKKDGEPPFCIAGPLRQAEGGRMIIDGHVHITDIPEPVWEWLPFTGDDLIALMNQAMPVRGVH